MVLLISALIDIASFLKARLCLLPGMQQGYAGLSHLEFSHVATITDAHYRQIQT